MVFLLITSYISLSRHPIPKKRTESAGGKEFSGRLMCGGQRGRIKASDAFYNANNIIIMKRLTASGITALFLLAGCLQANGQKWSIATNLLDYANFLTLNMEAGVSVHRHWSISAKGRYNPFSFPTALNEAGVLQNRTGSVSAGFKYWPFFVYSGMYCGGRIQWSRYNSGGIFSSTSEEGDALGIGFNIGYSLLVTKHLNIEFGIGLWFGGTKYRKYASTRCGKLIQWGTKPFIAPNDLQINLLYTF